MERKQRTTTEKKKGDEERSDGARNEKIAISPAPMLFLSFSPRISISVLAVSERIPLCAPPTIVIRRTWASAAGLLLGEEEAAAVLANARGAEAAALPPATPRAEDAAVFDEACIAKIQRERGCVDGQRASLRGGVRRWSRREGIEEREF